VVQISAVDADQTGRSPFSSVVDRASRRSVPQRQSRLCPAPPRRICAPVEIAAVLARQPCVNRSTGRSWPGRWDDHAETPLTRSVIATTDHLPAELAAELVPARLL